VRGVEPPGNEPRPDVLLPGINQLIQIVASAT
jgi:hypothetical protein